MIKLFLFIAPVLCFSCASVDIDKIVRDSGGVSTNGKLNLDNTPYQVFVEPDIVTTEKILLVPEKEVPPPIPAPGRDSVQAANNSGIVKPSDFSHAAVVYDYHPDRVYEIYAQPLRLCDICLEPGERALDVPVISDSERWILGAAVSFDGSSEVQHIYVKPSTAGLDASLVINTDRRVYHIILRSYNSTHMPIVRWRYVSGLPNNFSRSPQSENGSGIDPRFLSFNYRINYSVFRKPVWLPKLVFDDGSKTYITFPDAALQRELPAVFENRKDVLNYRVNGNVVIIDKLIENITVKIQKTEITIAKKRG
jgi:type IV secretion system protein VirB9